MNNMVDNDRIVLEGKKCTCTTGVFGNMTEQEYDLIQRGLQCLCDDLELDVETLRWEAYDDDEDLRVFEKDLTAVKYLLTTLHNSRKVSK